MKTNMERWIRLMATTIALASSSARLSSAATLAGLGLRPGEALSAANAPLAEGLLPPEILAFYSRGDWTNRIADWPNGKMQREKEFVECTRTNAGRFSVDDTGSIVERADGKRPVHVIGFPFSPIDAADLNAGVEIIWNYSYGSYNVGNL